VIYVSHAKEERKEDVTPSSRAGSAGKKKPNALGGGEQEDLTLLTSEEKRGKNIEDVSFLRVAKKKERKSGMRRFSMSRQEEKEGGEVSHVWEKEGRFALFVGENERSIPSAMTPSEEE